MAQYNVIDPGKLVAGQPEDVSTILTNFQAIASIINGLLDNANLSPSASISITKLTGFPGDPGKVLLGDGTWGTVTLGGGGGQAQLPPGLIFPYAGPATSIPSGWLLCDGSAVSRTAYPALFALIGVVYGGGDGSSTFNLPDLGGRVPVGRGSNAEANAVGQNEGSPAGERSPRHNSTISNLTIPAHTHTVNESPHGHNISDPSHTHQAIVSGISPSGGEGIFGAGETGNTFVPPANNDIAPAFTGVGVVPNTTGITINPAGATTGGGTVGPGGSRPTDTPAYLVLNYLIHT